MSDTARDLVKGALRILGVVATSETPSAEEQTDALLALNHMLDSWSTESLIIFKRTIETFPLVGGTQSYTIGATGTFATQRPMRINRIATLNTASTPNQELPIEIVNMDQWADIVQKSLTSTFATKMYPDFTNPLLTLNFWPIPTIANSVVIYSEKPLVDIAAPSTVVDLPPGYAMAIKYNLAVVLSPEYGKQIDPGIAAIAASTLADVQRMNIQPIYMNCDPAIVSRGRTWDWRTGE